MTAPKTRTMPIMANMLASRAQTSHDFRRHECSRSLRFAPAVTIEPKYLLLLPGQRQC